VLRGRGVRRLKVYDEKIYFTLFDSHHIYISTLEGKEIKTFGKKFTTYKGGQGEGEFNRPYGLTVDEKSLYICDQGNHRIKVLQRENGIFISQWGVKGRQDGQLFCPRDIYICDDLFYVSDLQRVQVFTIEGIFVQVIGTRKKGESGEILSPYGLCLMQKKLYVADCYNNRIQVFV